MLRRDNAQHHHICAIIAASRLRTGAQVFASGRAFDLAVFLTDRCAAVIRSVERASFEDHVALATMMAEGDFVWAGLVYDERDGSEIDGFVETFHVSELNRLTSRLLELREVFGEAG